MPIVDQLDQTVKRHEGTLLHKDGVISNLERELLRRQDAERDLKHVQEREHQVTSVKEELHGELETASAYIIELEEKFYK